MAPREGDSELTDKDGPAKSEIAMVLFHRATDILR